MEGNLYELGYYETGTASITQGQTVVTGQGTAWSQIVRPADDFGKHVGRPIPIASVDSDTQITLAYPWPGPTQAAAPYRVTFTPYHVAYRQALQEIGQLLSSGNVSALAGLSLAAGDYLRATGPGAMQVVDGKKLDALAGLAGGADKLPYFSDADTMNQTTLSAFMRTLLDDADAAAALTTLGASEYVGMGLKETAPPVVNDCNTQIGTRVFTFGGTSIGRPPEISDGSIFQVQRGAGRIFQMAFDSVSTNTDSGVAIRMLTGASGGWTAWQSLIPTKGENANGRYLRNPDGTQICWHNISGTGFDLASSSYVTWVYPAQFLGTPTPIVTISRPANDTLAVSGRVGNTLNNVGFNVSHSGTSVQNVVFQLVAIGRWF